MDVIFEYLDENQEQHKFYVVGSLISWDLTLQERIDYAEVLFTGLLSYLKEFWGDYQKLPDEEIKIYDGDSFPKFGKVKTSWENYVLHLNKD